MNVIGIDIGGTKIKAGLINTLGEVLREIEIDTPRTSNSRVIVTSVIELSRSLMEQAGAGVNAVGVGSAGRIDQVSGTVIYATDNLPGWQGTRLKSVLEEALRCPVSVDNDVNTAALGEGWMGAGRNLRHYMMITLGTGVGGALVHDGKLISGRLGGAGEVGHMILYPHGLVCNCGQSGCFEQYVSGHALNNFVRAIDQAWDSRELMRQYELGSPAVNKIIQQFISDLSVGLISLQNIYDPEVIILGGGVMDTHPLWWEQLKTKVAEGSQHDLIIQPADLGNQAGMIGAAKLALDEIGKKQ